MGRLGQCKAPEEGGAEEGRAGLERWAKGTQGKQRLLRPLRGLGASVLSVVLMLTTHRPGSSYFSRPQFFTSVKCRDEGNDLFPPQRRVVPEAAAWAGVSLEGTIDLCPQAPSGNYWMSDAE